MNREAQRKTLKSEREKLIRNLKKLYRGTFDEIGTLALPEATLAKLTQLVIISQEGAINPLKQEIENPIITIPPRKDA